MKSTINRSDFIIGVSEEGEVLEICIPPATEFEVASFEKEVGVSLPDCYRNFLLSTNGGVINPIIAPYVCFNVYKPYLGVALASESPQGLSYLFTLSEKALEHAGISSVLGLAVNFREYLASEDQYPLRSLDFLPIGDVLGTNFIMLGIRGPHLGKVAVYERMEGHADSALEDVFHVADDFDEFLDGLYPCP